VIKIIKLIKDKIIDKLPLDNVGKKIFCIKFILYEVTILIT